MEESKKKPIMIGVIVVCLGVAAIITWSRYTGGGGGIDDIPEENMIWAKCNNPDCKAEYQTSEKAYHKYMMENSEPMAPTLPPMVCKECGEKSVYRAGKCGNPDCGVVFFWNSVPNDFSDRCPECNRSETEESRKARLRERAAGGTE